MTALIWAAAASVIAEKSARGIAERFQAGSIESLLASLFLLFLAVAGLGCAGSLSRPEEPFQQPDPPAARNGSTSAAEFGTGAAIGWGLALIAVLPMLLSGNLHGRILWQPGSFVAILIALGTLAAVSLAEEVFFRGYIYRRLSDATGPAWAAVLMSILFGALLVAGHRPPNLLTAFLDCTLFGILLAVAYLRTHALWLGWGLHFAYRAVTAVLLGLPIAGHVEYGSIADVLTSGPRWLTGGAFGPDAALLTSFVLLGASPCCTARPRLRVGVHPHADHRGGIRSGHRSARGTHRNGAAGRCAAATGADPAPHLAEPFRLGIAPSRPSRPAGAVVKAT